uniref:5'-3' exoribonuclease n=1 Tax=Psilocybe cubensis TaxID=181762 RepID=A0A8H7Y0J7_PSICU
MGVPALFRWLSKKYPKIIYPVVEEEDTKIVAENGEQVIVPVNMASANPNGMEFDNLYLDMNGIVHPCTHPEGKPAPETEEEMMLEIFSYTERVVNMIRPRKLLFMAIDGVAPRAKMNQQRSRRFRSSQEAKEKEEARKESVLLWEAMGKEVSEDEKNKVSWDSNAITPGTPFMDLLASSLRYWVVQKMNTDPGWKGIQVLISDAGVPGEGEHKIMDFIRRQRSNPGHDPNTKHVIYGLDADLIMLALATHEPYFRVLREDVFANDTSPTACRMCGQEGHYAAQCTGTKAEIQKKPPAEKKPFIFLDVAILREYLEVELDVPTTSFPFSLEEAIDDWVLLIFFVGNDFLPHLPSLEIREGAIDTLLKIWKQELPRMGGYLTHHGELELSRAQIILEGLAKREDEIFRRRREAEERQDQNAKRRKLEQQNRNGISSGPSQTMALKTSSTNVMTNGSSKSTLHPSLPQRPTSNHDFGANADSIGLGAAPTPESIQNIPTAAQALAGSNRDVVANRRAIRMANMSAAEVLKAELSGLVPLKPPASSKPSAMPPLPVSNDVSVQETSDIPGLGANRLKGSSSEAAPPAVRQETPLESDADADGEPDPDTKMSSDETTLDGNVSQSSVGAKRKFEEGPGSDDITDDVVVVEEDDEDAPAVPALKVNADGTVEQEDTVKLWEPGYKERYYRQKFGVELTDTQFKKDITKAYIEGLSWVLRYYYQGTPSWQWFYPYHFAPFAADFEDVDKMDIKFELGQPFKPFEQLMGVFPAASRQHIPEVFHRFMIDEDSPIIDFYPPSFEIDMNGKKMAWQGVALLPFIDQKRLLDAMAIEYPNLSEDEIRRNRWGNNVIFASVDHPIYPFYEKLYGKRKNDEKRPVAAVVAGVVEDLTVVGPVEVTVLTAAMTNFNPGRTPMVSRMEMIGQDQEAEEVTITPTAMEILAAMVVEALADMEVEALAVTVVEILAATGAMEAGMEADTEDEVAMEMEPPNNSYGNPGGRGAYGGYGGESYSSSADYGGYNGGNRGGYNGQPPAQNSYGSYGSGGGNNYGGYGGYGSGQHPAPPSRGGAPYNLAARGRGRTW